MFVGHAVTAAGIALFLFLLAAIEGKPSWRRIFDPDRKGEGGVLRFASWKRLVPRPMDAITMYSDGAQGTTAIATGAGMKTFEGVLLDASLLRFEVSYGKAYAALAMGRESRQVLQKAKDKPLFMQSLVELADGPMFLEGGGQLIRDKEGEVIGAIATTGDTNEVDDLCAIAGIRAAGFKTDHDFSEADMRRLNIKRGAPIEDPEKAKAAHLKTV